MPELFRTVPETEDVRHLKFVTRAGIESFQTTFPELTFHYCGSTFNRLLEIARDSVAVRFHVENMGAVIALDSPARDQGITSTYRRSDETRASRIFES
ncbi:hypothetical protein [Nesterenkonia ebinurensis]|uniref:hypothetical protein n=1 Tax=Nesterenkonia ebinurensis TaxID=2608252 RepID=UPI00123D139E|nr:hypothetical protein [Nesterenkonia ebinurensis]